MTEEQKSKSLVDLMRPLLIEYHENEIKLQKALAEKTVNLNMKKKGKVMPKPKGGKKKMGSKAC